MKGKRGSECLLKSVSNIDFNPTYEKFDNLNEELTDVIDQVLIICSQYDIDPTS